MLGLHTILPQLSLNNYACPLSSRLLALLLIVHGWLGTWKRQHGSIQLEPGVRAD
jgi:hypothetical protein